MFKPPQESFNEAEVRRQEMERQAQRFNITRGISTVPSRKRWHLWLGDRLIDLGTRLKGMQ